MDVAKGGKMGGSWLVNELFGELKAAGRADSDPLSKLKGKSATTSARSDARSAMKSGAAAPQHI